MTAVLKGLDDESRQMAVETVRQLRKRLLTKEKVLEYDKKEIFPEEAIREMLGPDIGLQLLFIPEEYGGMGGGARDCCAVTREMARICLGIGTAFFAIQLGSEPLMVGGTEEQKQKWLGAISEGSTLVAYAVTEANAGSNLAALRTKAEPVKDESGNVTGYVINGTKQFISTGGYADFITLLANTPEGPSFFVVEKGTKGFVQGKSEEKHGIRASNTSPLSFDDVFVPIENLVGGVPGQGMKHANQVFGYTRLMVAAMALGAADAAMDIAIPYSKERVQFGSPLCEKQGYTHKLIVPHAIKLEAASSYVEEIAIRLDSGENDLQVEGSIAKLVATDCANKAADDAMQALGGYGYIAEYEVEKISRDVRITSIYEGTSEIQQNIISTFRWKKTRKSKGEYYGAIAAEMYELDKTVEAGCRLYGHCANILNQVIEIAHDSKLTKSQCVMFGLADMMAYTEVGVSIARRAKRLAEAKSPEAEKIRLMSKVFANDVSQIIVRNANLILGTDEIEQGKASAVTDSPSYAELIRGARNVIKDMDRVADILFERMT